MLYYSTVSFGAEEIISGVNTLNKSKTNMKLHHSNVGQYVCAAQYLV